MKNSSTYALIGLVRYSPDLLFLSMALSFIIMFAVEMFFYANLYSTKLPYASFAWMIGIAIGIMIQTARFAFGLAGAYDFSRGRNLKGLTGLAFSLGLTIFASFEVYEIALFWSESEPSAFNSSILILQAIVWLGFLLEIRMAIALSVRPETEELEEEQKDSVQQLAHALKQLSAEPASASPKPAKEEEPLNFS